MMHFPATSSQSQPWLTWLFFPPPPQEASSLCAPPHPSALSLSLCKPPSVNAACITSVAAVTAAVIPSPWLTVAAAAAAAAAELFV